MLRHCLDCTTAYAVDLLRCPHCGSGRVAGARAEAVLPGPVADAPPAPKVVIPAPRKATP